MVFNIKNNVSLAKFTQWSILNYVSESASIWANVPLLFIFEACLLFYWWVRKCNFVPIKGKILLKSEFI